MGLVAVHQQTRLTDVADLGHKQLCLQAKKTHNLLVKTHDAGSVIKKKKKEKKNEHPC